MIGNDIVSLLVQRSGKRLLRYGDKIFSAGEEDVLKQFELPVRIAIAWSLKESAFKYFTRKETIGFIPRQYQVTNIEKVVQSNAPLKPAIKKTISGKGFGAVGHYSSTVCTSAGCLYAKSIVTGFFVCTVIAGSEAALNRLYWGIGKIAATAYRLQHTAVRKNLLAQARRMGHVAAGSFFEFSFQGNAPCLYANQVPCNMIISFSHDGPFVAHAYSLP